MLFCAKLVNIVRLIKLVNTVEQWNILKLLEIVILDPLCCMAAQRASIRTDNMIRKGVVWCVPIKEGFVGGQGRLWEIGSKEEEKRGCGHQVDSIPHMRSN